MDDKLFEQLMESVRWAKDHMAGKPVKGGRVTVLEIVDVKKIRTATGLTQDKFAGLIHVKAATLRNWEQGRRRPTGPAQALLKVIEREPKAALKALAA